MKNVLLPIFTLLLLISLSACSTSSDSKPAESFVQKGDWTTYSVSNFTFEAPSSWEYSKAGDEFLFFESGYVLCEWDGDLNEPNADDEFISNYMHLIELSYEDFQLISGPTRVMFSGCNGITFDFQYTADAASAQGKAVVLFDEGGMLTFTLCDFDVTSLHTTEFDALIASLQNNSRP